jgi:hypothetical protein
MWQLQIFVITNTCNFWQALLAPGIGVGHVRRASSMLNLAGPLIG